MTKFYHEDITKSKMYMERIENRIIALATYDMVWMRLQAKIVYDSKREIDDHLLFWASNEGDKADFVKILGHLSAYFQIERRLVKDTHDITELLMWYSCEVREALIEVEPKSTAIVPYTGGQDMSLTFAKSQNDSRVNELVDTLNTNSKGMSPNAIKEIQNVLEDLNNGTKEGGEYSKNMTFLKACADLNFGIGDPEDETDMDKVLASMNETHYGMDEAKDLIIEFMGVKQLNKEAASPQFIFVGPAGTGKTTLALQIAKALGRKSARVSLGGMKDDSALRGHGRTYLGSKAGRIMDAIAKTGTSNPVIVLDEIDKMAPESSADAVLLEILDPAQNVGFTDSYFNFAYDLSNVIFIATANYPERIDEPIIDRMELIECAGYTLKEKVKIATKYVIPKVMKEFGLKNKDISLTGGVLKHIINGWTREAGMRSLEQSVAKILRGAVLQVIKGKKVKITKKYVEKRLGRIIWEDTDSIETTVPGTVNGLAISGGFTGAVIQMESAFSNDRGIKLLGQTGDMMNSSKEVGMEFLSNNIDRYGIDESVLTEVGIATLLGAISTNADGDSASITMLTSWVSLLLDRPVNANVAMTGSISLNGAVRAIGGLDMKVAAGIRAGIKTFIISEENRRDFDELPNSSKNGATFHIVKHVDEVMFHALGVEAIDFEEEEVNEFYAAF
jgi:ATP-dependent Lon protease